MLAVIDMNTETKLAKKRGPKASGVEKEVLFMRVPVGMREKLKEVCNGVLSGKEVDVLCDDVNEKEFKGGREPEIPAFTEAKTAKEAIAQPYKEVEELKALNWKLVEENAALIDEVAGLKVGLEECRNLTYDEKMAYWKARVVGLEEQIKRSLDQ